MPTKLFFKIIQDRPRVQSAAREQRLTATAAAAEPEADDDASSSGHSSNSHCVVCYGQAREGIKTLNVITVNVISRLM